MPSLERFFNPQMRVFSANITSLPSARLYFFEAGSTTPKVTYADKQGAIPNTNPVIASATGSFPPIFLDGLYRVELRSSGNIVQSGWPIDNVGQDTPIVPYASWSEIVTYSEFERVTDPLTGIVYRSTADNNLGNVPADSPTEWEVVIDPVPSSFTSNNDNFTWSDDGGQISLDVDFDELSSDIAATIGESVTVAANGDFIGNIHCGKIGKLITITTDVLSHGLQANPLSGVVIPVDYRPASELSNVFFYEGLPGAPNLVATFFVDPVGSIIVTYRTIDGADVDRTTTPRAMTISFVKQ